MNFSSSFLSCVVLILHCICIEKGRGKTGGTKCARNGGKNRSGKEIALFTAKLCSFRASRVYRRSIVLANPSQSVCVFSSLHSLLLLFFPSGENPCSACCPLPLSPTHTRSANSIMHMLFSLRSLSFSPPVAKRRQQISRISITSFSFLFPPFPRSPLRTDVTVTCGWVGCGA